MSEEEKSSKELHWSEIDDATRIDRLRDVVKTLERKIERLEAVARFFEGHHHIGHGETPGISLRHMSSREPTGHPGKCSDKDVYF